MLDITGMPPA